MGDFLAYGFCAYFVIFPVDLANLFAEDLPIFVAQIINLLYNISHLNTLQSNILR